MIQLEFPFMRDEPARATSRGTVKALNYVTGETGYVTKAEVASGPYTRVAESNMEFFTGGIREGRDVECGTMRYEPLSGTHFSPDETVRFRRA